MPYPARWKIRRTRPYPDGHHEFFATLVAPNGEVILPATEFTRSKPNVLTSIAAVAKWAASAEVVDESDRDALAPITEFPFIREAPPE